MRKLTTAASIAAAMVFSCASPASAAALLDAGCLLATGCKFSGNIQSAGTALEAQLSYNTAKNPDIILNYLGKSDDPFGAVSGGSTGTWSLPGYVVDYIAVKSGPNFMLYSVTPGESGFYSTAGLQNGNNKNLPALSHLAFFGSAAGAVPEPATWALMIIGFGGIGASMRYRRKESLATA